MKIFGYSEIKTANRFVGEIHKHDGGYRILIEISLENGETMNFPIWERRKRDLVFKIKNSMVLPMKVTGVSMNSAGDYHTTMNCNLI